MPHSPKEDRRRQQKGKNDEKYSRKQMAKWSI